MQRSRSKPKLSSVWWCERCRLKLVALGIPKSLRCDRCKGALQFVEAVKPRDTG